MGTGGESHAATNIGKERMMLLIRIIAVIMAALMSTHAYALEPWTPTDVEMISLPPFCKVRMKSPSSSPEYKLWAQKLGQDFMHTHHYCAALNFLNRYYRSRNPVDKRGNLEAAVDNFGYMVGHASPNYSLMPEVYLNRGRAYSLMKRDVEAITDLNQALKLNPRLVYAYNLLANYYERIKQNQKALETITTGLQYNPGAISLKKRYNELGGKLPYPEPIQAAPVLPPVVPEQAPTIEAGVNAPTPDSTDAPAKPIVQPKIGSPSDPYCRFCTD
jgi:tetratricopeptide (TPR) repeat protein